MENGGALAIRGRRETANFFFLNILGDCARFNPLYMLNKEKKEEREKARIDITVMNVEKI